MSETSSALISPCGLYRYQLRREWIGGRGLALFAMLNPSKADALVNDPTSARCISFAQRLGFAGLILVNLYAYRATDPLQLREAADPVGPDNDEWIARSLRETSLTICAWGAGLCRPSIHVDRVRAVQRMLQDERPTYALGLTKHGDPRHPLYLPGDAPLIAWAA